MTLASSTFTRMADASGVGSPDLSTDHADSDSAAARLVGDGRPHANSIGSALEGHYYAAVESYKLLVIYTLQGAT